MSEYKELIKRNIDYIPDDVQRKIGNTTVLIAGCGIGSAFAETAVRLGYKKFILVDHDTIEEHNLNRQNYTYSDVGGHKVDALAKRMKSINVGVEIEIIRDKVTVENAEDITQKAHLIFDTIDFIDLPGLIALHDACTTQNKPIITAVSAGFGAVCAYFPAKKKCTMRDMFELPKTGSVSDISYAERYTNFVDKIKDRIDPAVQKSFYKTMLSLKEGVPCPASQVSPGAVAVAALAGTIAVRVAAGLPILEAPDLIISNLSGLVSTGIL